MYKWLTIMGIVCLGFIVVLLSLGYLLKNNEVASTALKQKLDQQKQLNSSAKNPSNTVLTIIDAAQKKNQASVEKINYLKNVIVKNITCASSKQCVLVNTGLYELNCTVAVNTIGASLLGKALKKDSGNTLLNASNTRSVCDATHQIAKGVCKQNMCQLEN